MLNLTNRCKITEAIQFAVNELIVVLGDKMTADLEICQDKSVSEQGYKLTVNGEHFVITGGDEAGVMYGILDLKKKIKHNGCVREIEPVCVTPYIKNRGIKFNIPLDARTPSYSDASDSASKNIKNMWERDFWIEFLDRMAINKYNVLSLWSLSPFPSLVRIPEFPEAALDDVKRTTKPIKASLEARNMYEDMHASSLITLKKITIDEKIEFWKWVMEYAKKRCIKVMIFTWNVFVFGTEQTSYGLTDKQDNPITKEYVYCGTKALMNTYPLLAGIGITSGENMRRDDSDIEFISDTYGRAIKEVLAETPERDFRFIHRMQMTRYDAIMKKFEKFPCPFEISFKYSQAHMYSNTKPTFIDSFLNEKSKDVKIWLTVRNDDFYMYRWGDPEYAYEYLKQMPVSAMQGFYMGPDGFTWGKDYIDKRNNTHPLIMSKMWYMFEIWGQLSYNLNLKKEYFKKELKEHFEIENSKLLYDTWQHASLIIPLVNCTHWHDFDFQWYPEGCCMSKGGRLVFADINEFIACDSVPGDKYLSVEKYCEAVINKQKIDGVTPLEQAEIIRMHVDKAIKGAEILINECKDNIELHYTIDDIIAMSYLGYYYSLKIEAAVSLCMYRKTGDNSSQYAAISLIQQAKDYWKKYSLKSKEMYKPQVLTRLGDYVDVERFNDDAEYDVFLTMEK